MSIHQLTKITANRAAKILQELGFKGKVNERNGYYFVTSGSDGHPFYIYFFKETPQEPDQECNGFEFSATWAEIPDHEAEKLIQVCNKFNSEVRYVSACVSGNAGERYLNLTWDQLYPDGISDVHFSNAIDTFINLMNKLYKECKSVTDESDHEIIMERHKSAVQYIHGPEKNYEKAAELYRLNANIGFAGSLNNLGDLYENGQGVPKNDLFAVYYYTRAAERAEPTAYLSLATILSKDQSDREILMECIKFLMFAIVELPEGQNLQTAKETFDEISQKLDFNDLNLARELALQWRPLYIEPRRMGDTLSFEKEAIIESNSVH